MCIWVCMCMCERKREREMCVCVSVKDFGCVGCRFIASNWHKSQTDKNVKIDIFMFELFFIK